VGVQKSQSGGFFVERRHFEYQGEKYGKFFHRTKDEGEAAFISDFVNHFKGNNNSTFNFENGRKVLEEHDPRLRQELDESLARCNWPALNPKLRKKELRKCFIDEAEKLWNEYKGEILKDHIRPSQMPSKNNVVEQLNHGHEDSVQEQDHIRSLHNGSRNITLEQLNHGYENRLAGECSMTKQTEEHVSNMTKQTEEHVSNMTKQTEEHVSNMTKQTGEHGGSLKFDVDVGLLTQAHEEPVLKKKLPLPPSLEKDPQGSCSQSQEVPNEGTDARGQKTEPNQENKMEIRRDGYKKWLEISDKFLKFECSEVKVFDFLVDTASTRRVILKVCAQMQCAHYEEIHDAVNDVIDSECISKEKLDKYRAETEPILEQCRDNWHS